MDSSPWLLHMCSATYKSLPAYHCAISIRNCARLRLRQRVPSCLRAQNLSHASRTVLSLPSLLHQQHCRFPISTHCYLDWGSSQIAYLQSGDLIRDLNALSEGPLDVTEGCHTEFVRHGWSVLQFGSRKVNVPRYIMHSSMNDLTS